MTIIRYNHKPRLHEVPARVGVGLPELRGHAVVAGFGHLLARDGRHPALHVERCLDGEFPRTVAAKLFVKTFH